MATLLDRSAERARREVLPTRLRRPATAPVLSFEPVDPPQRPDIRTEGRYLVRTKLLGTSPMGRPFIDVSMLPIEPVGELQRYRIRGNGSDTFVAWYDHGMTDAGAQ